MRCRSVSEAAEMEESEVTEKNSAEAEVFRGFPFSVKRLY